MKMFETVSRAMALEMAAPKSRAAARNKNKEQIYRAKTARWKIASRSDRNNHDSKR
jgi:hypothetical protein